MSKFDRLIEAAAEVKLLRGKLREAEARLAAAVAAENGGVALAADDAAHAARAGTVARRILDLLEAEPTTDFDLATFRKRFPDVHPKSLRSTLAKLASEHRVDKRKRGVYRHLAIAVATNGTAGSPVEMTVQAQ